MEIRFIVVSVEEYVPIIGEVEGGTRGESGIQAILYTRVELFGMGMVEHEHD